MSDQELLQNIDGLLFQCAIETRELSQKKTELNQQVKVYKEELLKTKANIETTKAKVKSLDENIKAKENTLTQNKALAKSMKSTNGLLLHYEQTLKAELESRKNNYSRDKEEFDKRISFARATLQSYKEFYYDNPLAQKLLELQAEIKELQAKSKSYDEQIASKQEELKKLKASAMEPSSPEKPSEGVFEKHTENEYDKHLQEDTVEGINAPIQPNMEGHIPSEAVSEEDTDEVQNFSTPCQPAEGCEIQDFQQEDEQPLQVETEAEQKDKDGLPKDPSSDLQNSSIEEQFTVLEIEQGMEVEMDEVPEVVQTANREANENQKSLSQASSQETTQSSPARTKAGLATPTFPFTFSPGRSSQISDASKSPAFSFNLNSEPGTPVFFGFEAQDEDPSSPFTSSFFGEKKTADSKTAMEFLFNQPDSSEDFQFSFDDKSPDTRGREKDKTKNDFPFSFNF